MSLLGFEYGRDDENKPEYDGEVAHEAIDAIGLAEPLSDWLRRMAVANPSQSNAIAVPQTATTAPASPSNTGAFVAAKAIQIPASPRHPIAHFVLKVTA